MKILTILGARPQFIKSSVVSKALSKFSDFKEIIVHTGQHYDSQMSAIFFQQMKLQKPTYNLGISGGNHGAMTGKMMQKIEAVCLREFPDFMMVYGDTNSTLAGALVATKLHIPLAHVEAGLRSFNPKMPEEINRILTDRVSNLLFCPSQTACENLKKEGFNTFKNAKIIFSGDVMKEVAVYYKNDFKKPPFHLEKEFVLGTFHRAENVDNKKKLNSIITAFNAISGKKQLIVPLHPRTQKQIKTFSLKTNFTTTEPLGYLEMMYLLSNAKMLITDSGGLQKEAFFLKTPCMILREETEWQELLEHNFSVLVGADSQKIIHFSENHFFKKNFEVAIYGDAKASEKIVKGFKDFL